MNARSLISLKKSRITTIFVLLVLVFAISLFIHDLSPSSKGIRGPVRNFNQKIDIKRTTGVYDHAVIVAGHAVMKVPYLSTAWESEDAWHLLSYQKGQGFPQIISSHVQKGIEVVSADPLSVLIFSGGQTREEAGFLEL
jgi:hypothetical protein